MAGRDLTHYLKKILNEVGLDLPGSSGLEIIKNIKEKCCYIALDPEEELKKF